MACRKKQRLSAIAGSSLSLRALTKVLGKLGQGVPRRELTRDLEEYLDVVTPFGALIQHITLTLENKPPHQFYFAHPFALLYIMCERSRRFAKLLFLCCVGSPAGLILYFDETTAGNQFHPDTARESMCCYYTFKELPPWYRANKWGWFPLGYLKATVLDCVLGGMSRFASQVVQIFFGNFFNLAISGILLPGPKGMQLFKALICFFLQDEKAHKETFDLKGAGGTKCCRKCKNTLRCDVDKVPGGGYFFHISTARPEHFDMHTAESYLAMAQKLAAEHGVLSNDAFADLEQVLGLNYNPLGLLWESNKAIRDMCNPADVIHEDAQHTLLGSGGTVPLHINALLNVFIKHNPKIKPEAVDDCIRLMVWPQHHRKQLKDDFFSSRMVRPKERDQWPHLKGFASEMFPALDVLMYFVDVRLVDQEGLDQHIGCFRILYCIVFLLFSEGASKHGPLLMNLVSRHHDLILEVYGLRLASKPKIHQIYHIITWLVESGQLFTCFAPERFHKLCNSKGINVHGPALGKVILKRVLLDLFADLESETFAMECVLLNPRRVVQLDDFFRAVIPHIGTVHISFACKTRCGYINKGDLVRFMLDGQPSVGFLLFGASGNSVDTCLPEYYFVIEQCAQTKPRVWTSVQTFACIAQADLGEALGYTWDPDGVSVRPLRLMTQ